VTEGEPPTPSGHGNGRPSSYIGRVHLEVLAILLPVSVILVALGWSMRPQSTGFPAVPQNVLVTLNASGINGGSEVLHRTADNGAVLDVTADPASSAGDWTVGIDNLDGARLCTPSELPDNVTPGLAVSGRPTRVAPQHLTSLGTSLGVPRYEVKSKGPMFVSLCWSSDGPVNLNGSYLSAQFPDVDAHSNSQNRYVEVPLTLALYADSGNTADYAIQSRSTPTTFSADSWQWSVKTTTASALLRFSATNTSTSQHQQFTGFLSGIALGLAGGALIAILLELVGPLSRARDASHPV
jgi:hypothetical protein